MIYLEIELLFKGESRIIFEFKLFNRFMSEAAEIQPLSADLSLLVDFDFSLGEELFQEEELQNITYLDDKQIPICDTEGVSEHTVTLTDNKNRKTKKAKTENTKPSQPLMRMKKIPKSDIRNYFANMFLNTINSGEFEHAQNFFQTFMTKKCQFTTGQNFPTEANIPSIIRGNGPNLFAHYFLGMHVMFPDIVLKMHNSRMETCPKNKTTRIIANVECNFTKTVHIPYDLWIPPENLLEDIYAAESLEEITNVLRGTSISEAVVVADAVTEPAESTLPPVLPSRRTMQEDKAHLCSDTSNEFTTTTTVTTAVTPTTGTTTADALDDSSCTNTSSVLSKRKHSTSNNTSTTPPSPHDSSSNSSAVTTTTTGLPYYVPTKYIQQLLLAATPLAQPVPVHSVGQLQIIMDENKHILYMGLNHVLL